MNWDYAAEAFIEAVAVVGVACLLAVGLALLAWLATISISGAVLILLAILTGIFQEGNQWPLN